jgi:hypothetical protein
VEDDLETHTDGLPKPIYCRNKFVAGDPRCGWRQSAPTSDPTYKVTTSGPDYFYTWYRDSPEFNMRTGFRAVLGPSGNPGEFFYSDSAFFPLAKNHGQLQPCLAVSKKIDCSNGGRAFPKATKIASTEDNDQVFSFTSELHTFFQLRGTEKFTFQGVSFLPFLFFCLPNLVRGLTFLNFLL